MEKKVLIDESMVVRMKAQNIYVKDVVEINCHGGRICYSEGVGIGS